MTNKTLKLITHEDTKEQGKLIDAAIKSIKTRGAKLDKDIWIAAVSAMAHHAEHGDYDRINALVAAMPSGSRVNALRDFIAVHGKVTFCDTDKVFKHDKAGNFDLEGALSKSWTEFKPEPEYKVVTAKELLTKLVKAASAKSTERTENKLTAAERAKIVAFAADMGVQVDG